MRPLIIRDIRRKEKFQIDDTYLNGYAKLVTPSVTVVYLSLCRHADINQESFPSLKLIAEEHSITTKTVQRAIKKLTILNIIHFERIRSNTGKWLNNTYILLDKSVWQETTGHQRPMVQPQDISALTTGHQRPTKDTHKKDTHIVTNAPASTADIVDNLLKEEDKKVKIRYPWQYLGLEIFEQVSAPLEKKSECIRIAKVYPEGKIMSALSFVRDYPRKELKWKMFLWKLNSLLKNGKYKTSSVGQ